MNGWVILIVLALVAVVVVLLYNRLVSLRQGVNAAYSDVDVQLKRRHDLIPNLVETVRGYATHERATFDSVTQARAAAIAAGGQSPAERAAAEQGLSAALRSLFAVAEAYPQLRAVEQFQQLSANLSDIENQIQFSRRFYNAQVRDYNTASQTFPGVIVAGLFGFKAREFFELEAPGDRDVPQVSFPGTPGTQPQQPPA
jgi:LemA protein